MGVVPAARRPRTGYRPRRGKAIGRVGRHVAGVTVAALGHCGLGQWIIPGDASRRAWEGPLGSQEQFHVTARRWFWWTEDVTAAAQPLSHDTRVVVFEPASGTAVAQGIGQTQVSFCFGDHVAQAEVRVTAPEGIESFQVEPETISLAVGATTPLRASTRTSRGIPWICPTRSNGNWWIRPWLSCTTVAGKAWLPASHGLSPGTSRTRTNQ